MRDHRDIVTVKDKIFGLYISAEQINARIIELGEQMRKDLAGLNPVFLSVLNGAFFFTADLMRQADYDCELSFVKVSSYQGMASVGKVQNLIGLNEGLSGRNIVIVEDIIDTGLTLNGLLSQLHEMNPASVRVATLLLKREALKYNVPVDYIGFECGNEFLVGYGLDYDKEGRMLKHIYKAL